jgi:DNA helicase HerA-like ATPase
VDPAAATGNEATKRIGTGYDTSEPHVTVGSVIVDGVCDPSALVRIALSTFNRHGLVAGATGTGKTKTLQGVAEQLSAAGVPVFMPDIKGDLSGLAVPGQTNDKITERAADTGENDWAPTAYPVEFFALAGQGTGVPVRATMDSFGPLLLSKVLGLNDTQESTLGLIFHWADQKNLPLLDIKDLRSVISYLTGDEGKADLKELGGVSSSTAGVILRAVTNLEAQGGDVFFGEPQLDVADLLRTGSDGRGIISLLEVSDLQTRPALFSTFLMWLLAELFEELPEVGDLDKPKLVFMFDESHLLFADASKGFLEAIGQTVRLIRSKGVGVFFCTQQPTDIPGPVLSQLGARVQHALRAFTPEDQQALSRTVKTYPKSPDYELAEVLTTLGTGEAIVTVLSEKGAPTPVAWTRVRPPRSQMAPADPTVVTGAIGSSPLNSKYGPANDRESAYEMLTARLATPSAPSAPASPAPTAPTLDPTIQPYNPYGDDAAPAPAPAPAPGRSPKKQDDGGVLGGVLGSPVVTSFLRSLGTSLGGALGRSMSGTRKRRR